MVKKTLFGLNPDLPWSRPMDASGLRREGDKVAFPSRLVATVQASRGSLMM